MYVSVIELLSVDGNFTTLVVPYGSISNHTMLGVGLYDGIQVKLSTDCNRTITGLETPMNITFEIDDGYRSVVRFYLSHAQSFQHTRVRDRSHSVDKTYLCMSVEPSPATYFTSTGVEVDVAIHVDYAYSYENQVLRNERIYLYHQKDHSVEIQGYGYYQWQRAILIESDVCSNDVSVSLLTSGYRTTPMFIDPTTTEHAYLNFTSDKHLVSSIKDLKLCISEFEFGGDFSIDPKFTVGVVKLNSINNVTAIYFPFGDTSQYYAAGSVIANNFQIKFAESCDSNNTNQYLPLSLYGADEFLNDGAYFTLTRTQSNRHVLDLKVCLSVWPYPNTGFEDTGLNAAFLIKFNRIATYGSWVYPGETVKIFEGNTTNLAIEGYGMDSFHRIAFLSNCSFFDNGSSISISLEPISSSRTEANLWTTDIQVSEAVSQLKICVSQFESGNDFTIDTGFYLSVVAVHTINGNSSSIEITYGTTPILIFTGTGLDTNMQFYLDYYCDDVLWHQNSLIEPLNLTLYSSFDNSYAVQLTTSQTYQHTHMPLKVCLGLYPAPSTAFFDTGLEIEIKITIEKGSTYEEWKTSGEPNAKQKLHKNEAILTYKGYTTEMQFLGRGFYNWHRVAFLKSCIDGASIDDDTPSEALPLFNISTLSTNTPTNWQLASVFLQEVHVASNIGGYNDRLCICFSEYDSGFDFRIDSRLLYGVVELVSIQVHDELYSMKLPLPYGATSTHMVSGFILSPGMQVKLEKVGECNSHNTSGRSTPMVLTADYNQTGNFTFSEMATNRHTWPDDIRLCLSVYEHPSVYFFETNITVNVFIDIATASSYDHDRPAVAHQLDYSYTDSSSLFHRQRWSTVYMYYGNDTVVVVRGIGLFAHHRIAFLDNCTEDTPTSVIESNQGYPMRVVNLKNIYSVADQVASVGPRYRPTQWDSTGAVISDIYPKQYGSYNDYGSGLTYGEITITESHVSEGYNSKQLCVSEFASGNDFRIWTGLYASVIRLRHIDSDPLQISIPYGQTGWHTLYGEGLVDGMQIKFDLHGGCDETTIDLETPMNVTGTRSPPKFFITTTQSYTHDVLHVCLAIWPEPSTIFFNTGLMIDIGIRVQHAEVAAGDIWDAVRVAPGGEVRMYIGDTQLIDLTGFGLFSWHRASLQDTCSEQANLTDAGKAMSITSYGGNHQGNFTVVYIHVEESFNKKQLCISEFDSGDDFSIYSGIDVSVVELKFIDEKTHIAVPYGAESTHYLQGIGLRDNMMIKFTTDSTCSSSTEGLETPINITGSSNGTSAEFNFTISQTYQHSHNLLVCISVWPWPSNRFVSTGRTVSIIMQVLTVSSWEQTIRTESMRDPVEGIERYEQGYPTTHWKPKSWHPHFEGTVYSRRNLTQIYMVKNNPGDISLFGWGFHSWHRAAILTSCSQVSSYPFGPAISLSSIYGDSLYERSATLNLTWEHVQIAFDQKYLCFSTSIDGTDGNFIINDAQILISIVELTSIEKGCCTDVNSYGATAHLEVPYGSVSNHTMNGVGFRSGMRIKFSETCYDESVSGLSDFNTPLNITSYPDSEISSTRAVFDFTTIQTQRHRIRLHICISPWENGPYFFSTGVYASFIVKFQQVKSYGKWSTRENIVRLYHKKQQTLYIEGSGLYDWMRVQFNDNCTDDSNISGNREPMKLQKRNPPGTWILYDADRVIEDNSTAMTIDLELSQVLYAYPKRQICISEYDSGVDFRIESRIYISVMELRSISGVTENNSSFPYNITSEIPYGAVTYHALEGTFLEDGVQIKFEPYSCSFSADTERGHLVIQNPHGSRGKLLPWSPFIQFTTNQTYQHIIGLHVCLSVWPEPSIQFIDTDLVLDIVITPTHLGSYNNFIGSTETVEGDTLLVYIDTAPEIKVRGRGLYSWHRLVITDTCFSNITNYLYSRPIRFNVNDSSHSYAVMNLDYEHTSISFYNKKLCLSEYNEGTNFVIDPKLYISVVELKKLTNVVELLHPYNSSYEIPSGVSMLIGVNGTGLRSGMQIKIISSSQPCYNIWYPSIGGLTTAMNIISNPRQLGLSTVSDNELFSRGQYIDPFNEYSKAFHVTTVQSSVHELNRKVCINLWESPHLWFIDSGLRIDMLITIEYMTAWSQWGRSRFFDSDDYGVGEQFYYKGDLVRRPTSSGFPVNADGLKDRSRIVTYIGNPPLIMLQGTGFLKDSMRLSLQQECASSVNISCLQCTPIVIYNMTGFHDSLSYSKAYAQFSQSHVASSTRGLRVCLSQYRYGNDFSIDSGFSFSVVDLTSISGNTSVVTYYGDTPMITVTGEGLSDGMQLKFANDCSDSNTTTHLPTDLHTVSVYGDVGYVNLTEFQTNIHALDLKVCLAPWPSPNNYFFDTGLTADFIIDLTHVTSYDVTSWGGYLNGRPVFGDVGLAKSYHTSKQVEGQQVLVYRGIPTTIRVHGHGLYSHQRVAMLSECGDFLFSSSSVLPQGTPIFLTNLNKDTSADVELLWEHVQEGYSELRICLSQYHSGSQFDINTGLRFGVVTLTSISDLSSNLLPYNTTGEIPYGSITTHLLSGIGLLERMQIKFSAFNTNCSGTNLELDTPLNITSNISFDLTTTQSLRHSIGVSVCLSLYPSPSTVFFDTGLVVDFVINLLRIDIPEYNNKVFVTTDSVYLYVGTTPELYGSGTGLWSGQRISIQHSCYAGVNTSSQTVHKPISITHLDGRPYYSDFSQTNQGWTKCMIELEEVHTAYPFDEMKVCLSEFSSGFYFQIDPMISISVVQLKTIDGKNDITLPYGDVSSHFVEGTGIREFMSLLIVDSKYYCEQNTTDFGSGINRFSHSNISQVTGYLSGGWVNFTEDITNYHRTSAKVCLGVYGNPNDNDYYFDTGITIDFVIQFSYITTGYPSIGDGQSVPRATLSEAATYSNTAPAGSVLVYKGTLPVLVVTGFGLFAHQRIALMQQCHTDAGEIMLPPYDNVHNTSLVHDAVFLTNLVGSTQGELSLRYSHTSVAIINYKLCLSQFAVGYDFSIYDSNYNAFTISVVEVSAIDGQQSLYTWYGDTAIHLLNGTSLLPGMQIKFATEEEGCLNSTDGLSLPMNTTAAGFPTGDFTEADVIASDRYCSGLYKVTLSDSLNDYSECAGMVSNDVRCSTIFYHVINNGSCVCVISGYEKSCITTDPIYSSWSGSTIYRIRDGVKFQLTTSQTNRHNRNLLICISVWSYPSTQFVWSGLNASVVIGVYFVFLFFLLKKNKFSKKNKQVSEPYHHTIIQYMN